MEGKNAKASGYVGDLSADQDKALQIFRGKAQAIGLYKKSDDPVFGVQGTVGDEFLLRFLRARKFDLEKTQKMFNEYLEWRQKNHVDKIIVQYIFTELPDVRQFYPHGYHKTDKLGRPIYIERIGQLKLQQLFQITNEERLIKYYIQSYELLLNRIFPACSKAKGRRVDETFTILDLKGSSMKMMSKQVYNFIKLASTVAQDNYPEILGKMFIVNAPMLFSGVWAVIKPWLDEKTRNKITIIGSGFKDKLEQYIDTENIPEFLGGSCKCEGYDCLERNMGPWNPKGKTPLFPGEPKEEEEEEQPQGGDEEQKDDEEDEDDSQNLAALKNALMGLNLGGPQNKAPHNPNKYEYTTQNAYPVSSDTPLNTQIADNDDDDYDAQLQHAHILK
jgi:hypothetical protein